MCQSGFRQGHQRLAYYLVIVQSCVQPTIFSCFHFIGKIASYAKIEARPHVHSSTYVLSVLRSPCTDIRLCRINLLTLTRDAECGMITNPYEHD